MEEKRERGEGEAYRRQVRVYATSNSSRLKVPNAGRAPLRGRAAGCGRFVRGVGPGSGGKVVLVFHGPQRTEGKGEEEKEMEGEGEGEGGSALWFLTRSREEIPAHTHSHTQVQKH